MKRFILSVLFIFLTFNPASATTIIVFGQSTGLNLFTGDEVAGITTLDANNIPVTISTLNSAAVNIGGFFNLDAISTDIAVNIPSTNAWVQPYSGTFSITNGGFNYLSGIFEGLQLGIVGGQSFVFGSAQPPLILSFTSDVTGMPLDEPRAFSLSLTNVLPGVSISNSSFADFSSNVSGDASANVVPESSSLLLLGIGLLSLVSLRSNHVKYFNDTK